MAVVGAIYFRGQAQAWKDKCSEVTKELLGVKLRLQDREDYIGVWKAQADAARELAIQAVNDATLVQAKYDRIIAKIQDDPTIPTPDWLVNVAQSLKQQVAG